MFNDILPLLLEILGALPTLSRAESGFRFAQSFVNEDGPNELCLDSA